MGETPKGGLERGRGQGQTLWRTGSEPTPLTAQEKPGDSLALCFLPDSCLCCSLRCLFCQRADRSSADSMRALSHCPTMQTEIASSWKDVRPFYDVVYSIQKKAPDELPGPNSTPSSISHRRMNPLSSSTTRLRHRLNVGNALFVRQSTSPYIPPI
ncbi:hypothetical protein VTK73DRAFT_691 [Phialemonium thermophilum]|uniref:Uncharacterized protein n=1 Tax=Phialemonium thermophilum TaxID=223376 RepID=A0ABR3VUF7_9PEZI